jgi:transcriptional regulator with XRE-family HTH domain
MIAHTPSLVTLSDEGKPDLRLLLNASKREAGHLNGMTIGDRIRAARTKAGLTQRALAARLGIDKSAVAYWESSGNARSAPKITKLVEVARVLGVRPSELLGEPTQADKLVLEDSDEIALVTLYRKLPKRMQDAQRQMLFIMTEPSNLSEAVSHHAERPQVAS